MTDHITNARQALKRMMQDIPNLRAIDHMPDAWSDFPVAVIALTHAQDGVTLSGVEMEGEFTVTLLNSAANPQDALTDLDPLITSIRTALNANTHLDETVHYITLDRIDHIGMRKLGSQHYAAADLHLRFMATNTPTATP